MGQKTNQNILRLGQTKEWESKYIEKKSEELSRYTFNDLEVQKFINKFFERNGLLVNNCKISHAENLLHIYVSYFTTHETKQLINRTNSLQKIKNRFKKKKYKVFLKKEISLKKNILKYNLYNKKTFTQNINKNLKQLEFTNKIKQHYFSDKKFRRLDAITYYKKYKDINTYKNHNHIQANLFIQKIFQSIYFFLGKKTTIKLSLKQLNNDSSIVQTFSLKKKKLIASNLLKMRKFQKNNFFKVGVTLLYSCVTTEKSSELIAKYVAFYLKTFKQHKVFLGFLKNTLKIFLNKNFSNLKRVKISIKGRFNGAPRAKKNTLIVGIPPALTLNSNINYSESTSFSSNGTFGVKVWTYS